MAEQLEYAIRRLNWNRTHYGIVRMPGSITVGALPTLEEAEADRVQREAEVRARIANPFICGPNHAARSRLPEPIFQDWLRDAGIEPTQPGQKQPVNWSGWWEQARVRLSAEQVTHVWAGLDRVRFFEVAARPEGRIGYAVARVEWEYNDTWFESGTEGGALFKVFRRWGAAEEYRRELEQHDRRWRAPDPEADIEWISRYDVTRWVADTHWPLGRSIGNTEYDNTAFAHGGEAPLYEVIEVELPDQRAGTGDE